MPITRSHGKAPEDEVPQTVVMAPGEAERLIAANDALTEAVRALAGEKTRDTTTTAALMSGVIARQHPPEFDGTGDPVVLEDWLGRFGKIFTTIGCPDSLRVEQAACYLKGRADLWWYDNQDHLKLYHKLGVNDEEVFGWISFKKAIRDEFFPEHLCLAKRTDFDLFKKEDGMSVEEYYVRFMELSSYASDLNMGDEVLASRFERGLAIHILEKMPARIPTTVCEVYLKAGHVQRLVDLKRSMWAEKRRREGGDAGSFRQKRGSYSQQSPRPRYLGATRSVSGGRVVTSPVAHGTFSGGYGEGARGRVFGCRRCSKNHLGRLCDGRPVVCFECGRKGHRSFECRQGRYACSRLGASSFAPTASTGSVAPPSGGRPFGGAVSRGVGGSFARGPSGGGSGDHFRGGLEGIQSRGGFVGGRASGGFGAG
ncbi:hypothetical protein vseg_021029 [Gypsophila vaccaria]